MKKTITLFSALIFSLALMVPSLLLADDGKHMEEGSKAEKSSHGEYKDKIPWFFFCFLMKFPTNSCMIR